MLSPQAKPLGSANGRTPRRDASILSMTCGPRVRAFSMTRFLHDAVTTAWGIHHYRLRTSLMRWQSATVASSTVA